MQKPKTHSKHRIKFCDGGQKEGDEFARFTLKELCDRFSEEAHIKPKYVRYIINSFLKVVKQMILEGKIVKLTGLGDLYLSSEYTRNKALYTPLYKQYIYPGKKLFLKFKISHKFKEAFLRELSEKDAYIIDPIAFSFSPCYEYTNYYMDKNCVLREVERLNGRTERPKPIYTPEIIDKLCLEYGISYPDYNLPYKTVAERKRHYIEFKIKPIIEKRVEEELLKRGIE